ILDYYGIDVTGKNTVILGRSLVVGRPLAMLLMNRNATITICHRKTVNVSEIARKAEILISAMGEIEAVTADYLNPGQTVIDVGITYSQEKQKIYGDVLFEEAEKIVDKITPVPGGVGSVTTSVLVSHVVEAAKRANESRE
ncbi:MAG: bifunctional methylenetetrahydrofolate dehydrogenase/methenyltetrahydrofolate cyclohydrolase, partial [Erysipelotrichaceae bacterium]|nr:bifunctional methylenetetrahydrofolate dehydrogenase/methenyltetrahydrofolate cyclohydrolase [Erysipelotrichaceae bacterium]